MNGLAAAAIVLICWHVSGVGSAFENFVIFRGDPVTRENMTAREAWSVAWEARR